MVSINYKLIIMLCSIVLTNIYGSARSACHIASVGESNFTNLSGQIRTDILSLKQSAARAYAQVLVHRYAKKISQEDLNTLSTVVTAVKTIIDITSFADIQGDIMGWYHMIFELAYGDLFWSYFDTYKYASVYDQIAARKDILEAALGNEYISDFLGNMYKKTLLVGYRYLHQLAESVKKGEIIILGNKLNGIKLFMPKIYQGRKGYVQCSLLSYVCTHPTYYTANEKIDSNENISVSVYDEFLSMLSTLQSKNVLDKVTIFNSCDSSKTKNNTEESSVYVLEYLLRQADLDKDLMVYYYERAYWLIAHGYHLDTELCYYDNTIDAGSIYIVTFLKNIFKSSDNKYHDFFTQAVDKLEALGPFQGDVYNINNEDLNTTINRTAEKVDAYNNMYVLVDDIKKESDINSHLADLFERMDQYFKKE